MNSVSSIWRFLALAILALTATSLQSQDQSDTGRPNFIIIFCDDLGYGDLGCFGSKKIATTRIDRMASEGMRFTDFYVASGVCSPSRSSLLTGCYPRRIDMHENEDGQAVLFPMDRKGLHPDEETIADILKTAGYATACIGKWHCGDQPEFLPTRQGFDTFFGLPFSNDLGSEAYPLPLLENEAVIEAPVRQETLTQRYTEQAIEFIETHQDTSFFLYLPHTFPHVPVSSGNAFRGRSKGGPYGDCVEEIDWSTGEILDALKRFGIDNRTLVIFTSDNGATRGSNAPFKGKKGTTDEGGMRVPCVMRWPGIIPTGTTCREIATTMDLLPTFAKLGEADLPKNPIDGKDIRPLIAGEEDARSPHEAFFYYQRDQLQAVRSGKWKLMLPLKAKRVRFGPDAREAKLELFDLETDPGEKRDVSGKNPDIVTRLTSLAEQAREELGDGPERAAGHREGAWVEEAKPLLKADR